MCVCVCVCMLSHLLSCSKLSKKDQAHLPGFRGIILYPFSSYKRVCIRQPGSQDTLDILDTLDTLDTPDTQIPLADSNPGWTLRIGSGQCVSGAWDFHDAGNARHHLYVIMYVCISVCLML